MLLEDPHLYRPNRRQLWHAIAARIRTDPSCLSFPLDNIARWLARGRLHTAPLLEWRRRLLAAQRSETSLQELLDYLQADNEDAEPLKSCSPFPGLLSEAEIHGLSVE